MDGVIEKAQFVTIPILDARLDALEAKWTRSLIGGRCACL